MWAPTYSEFRAAIGAAAGQFNTEALSAAKTVGRMDGCNNLLNSQTCLVYINAQQFSTNTMQLYGRHAGNRVIMTPNSFW